MKLRMNVFLKLAIASFLALGLMGCGTGPLREVVTAKEAPAAIGPYSQAVKFGSLLFLSGQIPIDPQNNQVNSGSIEEQTRLVLENLKGVLAANGMAVEDILYTTVFLKDLNDFAKMNAVYGTYFKDKPPARATVQVGRLPRDVLVEISAVAGR